VAAAKRLRERGELEVMRSETRNPICDAGGGNPILSGLNKREHGSEVPLFLMAKNRK